MIPHHLILLMTCLMMSTWCHAHTSSGYLTYPQFQGKPYTVTYDQRSFFINNERTLFLSGDVHYPRTTPQMWPHIFKQLRADGLNMIQMYTFWNVHEHVRGLYDWAGNANVTQFLQDAADAGLFVNLRVGPYACAEFRYGGIPTWVGSIPGMTFREYNPLWMDVSRNWLDVLIAKVRPFFADRGGPIVVAQIENELHTGKVPNAQQYIDWCGTTAASFNLSIPWIMCNGDVAKNTINSCNANDCVKFLEKHGQNGRILIDQPAMWTENEGWFQQWGQPYPDRYPINNGLSWYPSREPQDVAYTVMRWFARGGSHMNYYMYQGGNHYSLWGASGLTTWYANDVNLNADGFPNEPKYTHLHRMHDMIISLSHVLVQNPAQMDHKVPLLWYDPNQHAFVNATLQYAWKFMNVDGSSMYWLENEANDQVKVQFHDDPSTTYSLYPTSISIPSLQYNTYVIYAPMYTRKTIPIEMKPLEWSYYPEAFPFPQHMGFEYTDTYPYEQLSTTLDDTSYIYYQHTFNITNTWNGNLTWTGCASNAYIIYWSGSITGDSIYTISGLSQIQQGEGQQDMKFSISIPNNVAQTITLMILSTSMGVDNGMGSGTAAQQQGIIKGDISYASHPLSNDGYPWISRPFLTGELQQIMAGGQVSWQTRNGPSPTSRPSSDAATWFRTTFPTPILTSGAVLFYQPDGMWRGEAYINGHSLGRYYMVWASENKLVSQSQYQIPLEWLTTDGTLNTFIFYEDEGQVHNIDGTTTPHVDPSKLTFWQSFMVSNDETSTTEVLISVD